MRSFKYTLMSLVALVVLASCGSSYGPLNPVPAPTPVVIKPAGLLDDWEDQNGISELGIAEDTDADLFGSTISVAYSAPGSTLPGGTPGSSARMSGSLNANVGPNWPWASMRFLIPSGWNPDTLAPTQRLHFSYKAGLDSVGITHLIRWNHTPVTDFCWYEYAFTPTNTNWTDVDIFLTPSAGSPSFDKCSWGAPQPWVTAKLALTYLMFMSNGSPGGVTQFDLSIDDVFLY